MHTQEYMIQIGASVLLGNAHTRIYDTNRCLLYFLEMHTQEYMIQIGASEDYGQVAPRNLTQKVNLHCKQGY